MRNTVPIHMRQSQISLPRLRQRLEQLGTIGRDPAGGVTRLPFSPAHVDAVRYVAQAMQEAGLEVGGHPRLTLPSWAGHDAAVLAHHAPAGMIFVTSSGGVSHSPREHTPWPAVEAGTQVLLDTLLLLDDESQEARLPLAYA